MQSEYMEPNSPHAEAHEGFVTLQANEPALQNRTRLQRVGSAAIVAAASAALLFEQGPANEALRVNIGLDVLQTTQSAAAVGLAVAATTAVIEMVPSSLISLGLNSEGQVVQRFKSRFSKKGQPGNSADSSTVDRVADKGANIGIALGLGAGLVTVKEHMKDPEPSLRKDLKTSAKASGVVATSSGMIGYLAAGGINHASGTVFEKPAELFVDYGTDAKFWIGALAVGYGVYYAKKGIESLRRPNNNASNIEAFMASRGLNMDGTKMGSEETSQPD